MKSLAKNTVFNMIYSVANLLFPIITSMYVSRILLPEGMGQVNYAQNIVSYFIVLASLGIPSHGVREMAKVRDDEKLRNKVFTELFLLNGITTVIATAAFLVLVFRVDALSQDRLLYLCCGIQLVLNCFNIDWFYKGFEEYVYIVVRSLAIKILSIFAIFALIHAREDYVIYALISSIAAAGNYIFNMIHVRRYVKLDFQGLKMKRHIQPVLVLAVSHILATIYAKVDITMLGSLATKAPVGFYSSAHRLVDMVTNLCISISAVFLPRLSNCYENDKEQFYGYLDLGLNALWLLVPPIFVGLNLVARDAILLVYGEAFAPAITTLRLLSALIVIKSFGDLLCYQVAIATGSEKKRLPPFVIAALLNVVLNGLLIPRYAQNGAAVASVASELFLNGYLLCAMHKMIHFRLNKRVIMQSIVSTGIMTCSILLLGSVNVSAFWRCVLMVTVGAAIYFTSNYLMGNTMLTGMVEKVKKRK